MASHTGSLKASFKPSSTLILISIIFCLTIAACSNEANSPVSIDTLVQGLIAPEQKITAFDGAASDNFGYSVSLSGNTAVIGAYNDDDKGSNSGAAYVYVRNGTTWSLQQKLTASDGAGGDSLGNEVFVSGDTAIIAASGDDDRGSNAGAVYVFVRSGTVWSQQQKLTASDGAADDFFGYSVSMSGDTAVIGAPYDDDHGTESGSAYVFARSGTVWSQQQKLSFAGGTTNDYFGYSVSVSGTTAVISIPQVDTAVDKVDAGAAFVYVRSGTVWSATQALTASDGATSDAFGVAVSVFGDMAVIGAHLDDDKGSNSGSAYVFVRTGTSWSQQQKLTASDGVGGDAFGSRVSASWDTAVIGAYQDDDKGSNSGSAYLFTRSGTSWSQEQKFTASDGAASDSFGISVSVSTKAVVIGANQDDDMGSSSGSAYTFAGFVPRMLVPTSGSTFTTTAMTFQWDEGSYLPTEWWLYVGPLQGVGWYYDSGSLSPSIFSAVVSNLPSNGSTIYVRLWYKFSGTWSYKDYTYVAYEGSSDALFKAKPTASDGAAGDFFGFSSSIFENTAVVGAYQDDDKGSNSGSAYMYVRSGTTWSQQQKLTASDGAAGDNFGFSVSVSENTAVIGAYRDDGVGTDSGSAYVYARSGTVWSQQQKLTASDGAASDFFGQSVAVSGNTAVVGAYQDDDLGTESGSAYVYVRSGTIWSQQQKLTASDGAAGDNFGFSVSISGNTAVIAAYRDDGVGTDSGSAYVFVRNGTTWTQQQKLTASDSTSGDYFGRSLAAFGNTVVIGAPQDDDNGSNSGSTYVFTRSGTAWTQQQKLTASDGTAGDLFGFSVSAYDNTAVIGAYEDDDNGSNSGSAYVFTRSGTTWNQQQNIIPSDGAIDDRFGYSVSISGGHALIGAYSDDDKGENSGSAYIYNAMLVPGLMSPVSYTTFSGDTVTFEWSAGRDTVVSTWWLYVGPSQGTGWIYDSGSLASTTLSATVSDLPTNGSTVYVRLWWRVSGSASWYYADYEYTSSSSSAPTIISPVSGSTLTGSIVTATWDSTGLNVTDHELWASRGTNFYFISGSLGTASSVVAGGLPSDGGSAITFRLWYELSGSWWAYVDWTVLPDATPSTPYFNNPWNGATLGGSSHTLNWDPNGVTATDWQLFVGNSVGANDLYDSGSLGGAATSHTVTGLPTDGRTLYVRLRYDNSGWNEFDFTFQASGP